MLIGSSLDEATLQELNALPADATNYRMIVVKDRIYVRKKTGGWLEIYTDQNTENLPIIGVGDGGKIVAVNTGETGYELSRSIEIGGEGSGIATLKNENTSNDRTVTIPDSFGDNFTLAHKMKRVEFTSNGTWTCPAGVTEIYVEMVGAGGAGGAGGADIWELGGNGGGGGGACFPTFFHATVTPNTEYPIVIGVGTTAASGQTPSSCFGVTSRIGYAGGTDERGGAGGGVGGAANGALGGAGLSLAVDTPDIGAGGNSGGFHDGYYGGGGGTYRMNGGVSWGGKYPGGIGNTTLYHGGGGGGSSIFAQGGAGGPSLTVGFAGTKGSGGGGGGGGSTDPGFVPHGGKGGDGCVVIYYV